VTLRLEPAREQAALSVRVIDRFGTVVVGTEVWATSQAPGIGQKPEFTESSRWTSRTGADGIARFDALPSGLFEVGCTDLDRGISMPEVFALAAGASPTIEVVLH